MKFSDLPPGTAALFACSASEKAFEHKDWGHGAFTHALLQQLQAGSAQLTANELSVSIHRQGLQAVREKTNGQKKQTVNPITNGIVQLQLRDSRIVLRDSLGVDFVRIPPGRGYKAYMLFGDNEEPQEVNTPALRISRTEVTVGQFRRYCAASGNQSEVQDPNVRWTRPGWKQEDDHPVVYLSSKDIEIFCQWMSEQENVTYRLPTFEEYGWICYGQMTPVTSESNRDVWKETSACRQGLAVRTEWLRRSGVQGIRDKGGYLKHYRASSVELADRHSSGLIGLFSNAYELTQFVSVLDPVDPYSGFSVSGVDPLGIRCGFRLVREERD